MKPKKNDAKKLFRKLGACSHTFFYILNRDFGNSKNIEERASDPLAGGIYQQGYQCGMLWGSALAAGTEAFKRNEDRDRAIGVAINATRNIVESFLKREPSIECNDITDCDWTSKMSMAKYFITGRFLKCFQLAEDWAPEAIESAKEGLNLGQNDLPELPVSCASEAAKMMGATDEEMVMVAGFAGGLGLSGNACGALAAAVWMKALERCRTNEKTSFKDPNAEETIEKFYAASDFEIMCSKITGKCFSSVTEHSEFIKNGGCSDLIKAISEL